MCEADAGAEGPESDGDGKSDAESGEPDSEEDEDPQEGAAELQGGAEQARVELECEPLPSADLFGGVARSSDWDGAGPAELLSAAGPARAPPDVALGAAVPRPGLERDLVNPTGYVWVSAVGPEHVDRLAALFAQWWKLNIDGGADVVVREELDVRQGFAHDIAIRKARERDASGGMLGRYEPLRLIMTGGAGTGKTRTVRCIICSRRRVLAETLGSPDAAAVRGVCAVAAPTGCASFQMRFGAATAHRIFGVPVHYCGPLHRERVSVRRTCTGSWSMRG
jgi:hypothetical protein